MFFKGIPIEIVCLIKLNKSRLKELLQRWRFSCFQFLFCVVLEFGKTHNLIFLCCEYFFTNYKHVKTYHERKWKKASKKLCINSFSFMSFFFFTILFMNSIYSNYKTKHLLYFHYTFVKNMSKYFIFTDIFLSEWYMMLKSCI